MWKTEKSSHSFIGGNSDFCESAIMHLKQEEDK